MQELRLSQKISFLKKTKIKAENEQAQHLKGLYQGWMWVGRKSKVKELITGIQNLKSQLGNGKHVIYAKKTN